MFSKPVFGHAQVLLLGAILAPGRRTVASALRIMGLGHRYTFQNYHRVLNRACWSARWAAHKLFSLLVRAFHGGGPLIFGLDDTIERRRGAAIKAKGIYRDPVRSSHGHFVKASGLRWLALMWLTPIRWAERVWALPFLTVLCPSTRYHEEKGLRHKKLTDWARQMLLQLRRWVPDIPLVVVADSSFAVIEFLAAVKDAVTFVTRLRLDAALYAAAPEREVGKVGRPRQKGERQPTLAHVLEDPHTPWQRVRLNYWYGGGAYEVELTSACALWYHSGMPIVALRWVLVRDPAGKQKPQAFLCTDVHASPEQILGWFVRRWSMEVTFEEARAHLGVETQRQWSDKAIARTTPCLLGAFSLIALMADRLHEQGRLTVAQSAWYEKPLPTFSDALASVRIALWSHTSFSMSHPKTDILKIPRPLFERLTGALAYAA
jgi:hypothetical protein